MRVRSVSTHEQLDNLRSDWNRAHAADPNANVFNSWGWLRGWTEATSDRWLMLAFRPASAGRYVAFLPLALQTDRRRLVGARRGNLRIAGAPMADQAGLVCAPGYEEEAVAAFTSAVAKLMRRLQVDRFVMDQVADPRWDALIQSFPQEDFLVSYADPTPCPVIQLPSSWDAYMDGSTRRRALLRRAEREGFFATHVESRTLNRYIEIFVELHQIRHGAKDRRYLETFRSLLTWTFREGSLYLIVLWHEDTPAAVNVGFLDDHRRRFHAYNGGWDDWFRKHSPRRIAELYSIRFAIERGYTTYDLGRGAEPYKFGYGARETENRNPVLHRRTAYSTARELLRRIPDRAPSVGT